MALIRSILLIINYKTFIVTVLALISTWLCKYYDIHADFPLTLIGIAIVFPVVFSIDSAYKRRERILALVADMRAHLGALNLSTRDWLSEQDRDFVDQVNKDLINVFVRLKTYCCARNVDLPEEEELLDSSIERLSSTVQKFRSLGLYLGEVSRVNQYISKIWVDVESIKAIRSYPTPVTLRAYSRVFIYTFPILYGPYFNSVSGNFSAGLEYMMPVVFSFILISLDNIQQHLENPFDQVGEDDVKFDVDKFRKFLKIPA